MSSGTGPAAGRKKILFLTAEDGGNLPGATPRTDERAIYNTSLSKTLRIFAITMKAKKQSKREETKLPFQQSRKWVESERAAILDYLHSHISNDEVKAAASYEFARESESFRYAAAMFKKDAEDEICAPARWQRDRHSPIAKGKLDDFDFLIMQWPGARYMDVATGFQSHRGPSLRRQRRGRFNATSHAALNAPSILSTWSCSLP